MIPDFTTTPPDWLHRSPSGRHGNWSHTANGIQCRADAIDALVYQFDGLPETVLAHDGRHAFDSLTTQSVKDLEDDLYEAKREVERLEDELDDAQTEVDRLERQIKAIKTAKHTSRSSHPTFL